MQILIELVLVLMMNCVAKMRSSMLELLDGHWFDGESLVLHDALLQPYFHVHLVARPSSDNLHCLLHGLSRLINSWQSLVSLLLLMGQLVVVLILLSSWQTNSQSW